jgi:hypothetical protein
MEEVKLCAVIRVHQAQRVRGVEPPTWAILEAELVQGEITSDTAAYAPHLHADDRTDTHHAVGQGFIRVCVPLTMVQESLPLGV